jgi:ribonuclease HI
LESKRRFFDIWTDGCALSNGKHMGAGYIIYEHDKIHAAGSEAIITKGVGSSTLAEISAATIALTKIPANAFVTLHSDSLDVLRELQKRTGLQAIGKQLSPKKKKKAEALNTLFTAAARHQNIDTKKTNDKHDANLKQAHCLAREGADKAKKLKP